MLRKHLILTPLLRLISHRVRFLWQWQRAETASVLIVDGAAQDGRFGEGKVGTVECGWVGRDVEEGILVEVECVDYFYRGRDRSVFGVLFGVEEVGLVGKRVVEEGDLGVVSDSW